MTHVRDFFAQEEKKVHQFRPSKLFANVSWVEQFLAGKKQPPITLELDPTLLCNDKCPFCVQGWALQGRELGVSQIDRILGEASDLGIQGVTLTGGGDPLMHTKINEVISLVQKRNFQAGIYTNGGAIQKPGLAETLVAAMTWVRVSLDSGSETSFQAIRGHSGYTKRIHCLQTLAAARAQGNSRCTLGASYLTSELNAQDILSATKDVRDAGFDYIQFKPLINWDLTTQHHRSTSRKQDGVFEAIAQAAELQTATFRVIGSPSKYEAEALGETREYAQYHAGWVVVAVAPNLKGEIRPTLYLECSVKYLSRWTIGEFDSLGQILSSPERENMIRNTSSNVYCVLPEKGATYSHLLETALRANAQKKLTADEIRALAPPIVEHPFSL